MTFKGKTGQCTQFMICKYSFRTFEYITGICIVTSGHVKETELPVADPEFPRSLDLPKIIVRNRFRVGKTD